MAKVKYTAGDSAADSVSVFGYIFQDGKSTEVKDEDLSKFQGNPFFGTAGEAKATKAKADNSTDDQSGTLKAVHIAGGRYSIKKGDEELVKGLSKHEAESFNEMSDEDKAEYVEDETGK